MLTDTPMNDLFLRKVAIVVVGFSLFLLSCSKNEQAPEQEKVTGVNCISN